MKNAFGVRHLCVVGMKLLIVLCIKILKLAYNRDPEKPQPQKTVLCSCPSKCGYFSLETKQNRKAAPRPKSFVSKRR
jgi:hypothetical protein